LYEFGFEIDYADFVSLLNNNQWTTLEYITDLIENRKIIIPDNVLKPVIKLIQNEYPEMREIFDYLI
jgi:hypothetical protein